MTRYVVQRLAQFGVVFFIVTFGVMVLLRLGLDSPGDPARTMLGGFAAQDVIDATNDKYRLHSNYVVQYGFWLKGLVIDQDLGFSVSNSLAVSTLIARRIVVTVLLGAWAIAVAVAIAVPLAAAQAYWRDRLFDRTGGVAAFVFVSLPAIVVAVLLKLVFVEQLGWFPRISAKVYPWDSPWEHVRNFALPVLTLALPTAAVLARVLRAELVLTLQADFIGLARAKGLAPRRILWRHGVRNSLFALVTAVSVNVGAVLGGAVIAETFFDLDGMGALLVVAVLSSDLFTVQSVTALLVVAVVAANLAADLLYGVIDPRVRVAHSLR